MRNYTVNLILFSTTILFCQISYSQWNNATNQGDIHYSGGNVGIGSNMPQYSLDVVNNLITINKIRIANAATGSSYNDGFVFGPENKMVSFYNLERGGFRFYTGDDQLGNNSEKMILNAAGNVGIGTSSPNSKLHIIGNTINDGDIEITGNVTANSNVGIGVSSPSTMLEVGGTITTQGLKLPLGAATGRILTSDANGNASWQTLPQTPNNTSVWDAGLNNSAELINGNQKIRIASNGNIDVWNPGTENKVVFGYDNTLNQFHVLVDDFMYVEGEARFEGTVIAREVLVKSSGWSDYVFDKDYHLMPLDQVQQFIDEHHHLPNIPSAETVEANGIDLGEMDAKLLEKIEELTLHLIEQDRSIEKLMQATVMQQITIEELKIQLEEDKK